MQVNLDFNKLGIRYALLALVIFLSVISCMEESSYASELNVLPRNRTEIDNIQNISINYDQKRFIVSFYCTCIFPISLEQHFVLSHLDIEFSGLIFSIQTNESNKFDLDREITWYYDCPIKGNATVKFYRSRTLLISKNFTDLEPTKAGNASIHCTGLTDDVRECEIYQTCFNSNHILYPSSYKATFPDPLIKFSSFSQLVAKKGTIQNYEKILQQNEIRKGLSLVVAFDTFDFLSWKWLYRVAAPLAQIVSNSKQITKVLAIGAPRQIVDSNLVARIADVMPVSTDLNCVESALIRHLKPSHEAAETLRQMILKEIPIDNKSPKLIILTGGNNYIKYSNINIVSEKITNMTATTIDIDSTSEISLITSIANADYVFASSGKHTSQAIWMRQGKFFEFVPEGYECMEDGSQAAQIAKVNYTRYVTSFSNTTVANNNYPCMNNNILEAPTNQYTINDYKGVFV